MATYNGARFLREQLDSIAGQTVLPAELVVCDDASADDTVAVVERFQSVAPFPVRVHRNASRLGYRANFMRAMSLCTGDVIALCDQDDVWDAHKIEAALPPLDEPDTLLSFHEAWIIDEAGRRKDLASIYTVPAVNPPLSLYPLRNPFGFSLLFRRELLSYSDLWDRSVDNLESASRMAHDQWIFFLASTLGTVAFVDQPLAGYRQHGANTYGFARPDRTMLAEMRYWIDTASLEYASFSRAGRARADVLASMLDRLDGPARANATLAIEGYRLLATHCALRSAAYGSKGVPARLRGWGRMVRGGAYGKRARWAFGRRTALKELLYLAMPRGLASFLSAGERARSGVGRDDPGARPDAGPVRQMRPQN